MEASGQLCGLEEPEASSYGPRFNQNLLPWLTKAGLLFDQYVQGHAKTRGPKRSDARGNLRPLQIILFFF